MRHMMNPPINTLGGGTYPRSAVRSSPLVPTLRRPAVSEERDVKEPVLLEASRRELQLLLKYPGGVVIVPGKRKVDRRPPPARTAASK